MTAPPRLRKDYDRAITGASLSALAELALALGSYRDSIVLGERFKEKDAYDVYSVVGHCLGGPEEVAGVVAEHLGDGEVMEGVDTLSDRFRSIDAEGPACVASFMEPTDAEARARATADVFVVMDRFLRSIRE